jgi:cysteine desulfurase/selenocysteine lyase
LTGRQGGADPERREGSPIDVEKLRAKEFSWIEADEVIYLNAASTGPQPKRTVDTLKAWADLRGSMHKVDTELQFGTLRRSRELCARLVGAKPSEIALATNTGFGLNLAARALPLKPGDVVVTPDAEFPANVYPWHGAARARGLEYRRLKATDGVVDDETVLRALDDKRVKCLSVSWIGFANGAKLDLVRIGRMCRDRGVFFVVDAMQGLGAFTLDARAANIDVLACGAQKWLLGPWGSAFTYVRSELIETLEPPVVGWMAPKGTDDFSRLLEYDFTWRNDARRFEQITLPYQDFAGMNTSLELLEELGYPAIGAHVNALADEIVKCADAAHLEVVTPRDKVRRAGIVSVRLREAARASERLKKAGVVHSLREGAIRLSPHVYNTAEEIRKTLELL